jgi:hypothetical protein
MLAVASARAISRYTVLCIVLPFFVQVLRVLPAEVRVSRSASLGIRLVLWPSR